MEFKIIIKKIKDTLSVEESMLFEKWYDESQEHRDYFHKVEENYFQRIEGIDKKKGWLKIEKRIGLKRSHTKYWKYSIAASVLLLVAVFFIVNNYSNKRGDENIVDSLEKIESVIEIGSNQAILTLEDGLDIVLSEGNAINHENLSSDGEALVYHQDIDNRVNKIGEVKYNTLTIPRGGEFVLQLSDGTKVWLNSDSKIKYPVTFINGHNRKVELIYGEAYFEVSPAENHNGASFEVISKAQEITVLGTEFNVKAYEDEEQVYSTLVEGSIELRYNGKKQILNPNDQAIIHKGSGEIMIQPIDVYNEIAWRKGEFGFEKETLGEIMKVLSRWYDVEIEIENKEIEEVRFTGVFNKKQRIENILTIISKSNDLEYEIIDKSVVLK